MCVCVCVLMGVFINRRTVLTLGRPFHIRIQVQRGVAPSLGMKGCRLSVCVSLSGCYTVSAL